MYDRAHDIADATRGTCNWLLKHSEYLAWAASDHGDLLWIKGLPGSGKSTLLRHALDNIQSSPNLEKDAIVLSFFYHGRGSALQQTPAGLYRSLLHQLGQVDSALVMDSFKKLRFTLLSDKVWRPGELQRMLKSALRQVLETRPVWIFVDALDESGEDNAVALIDNFRSWSQDLEEDGLSKHLHICFTCRHYPNLPSCPGERLIYVERENGKDIKAFIRNKIGPVLATRGPVSRICDMIIERAGGVFLWVWLVIREILDQERRGQTLATMEATVLGVPKDLNELYIQYISKMGVESLKLIQWTCFATRPLSLRQWRGATLMDNADCQYQHVEECASTEEFRPDDEQLSRQVRELSCGLIEATGKNRGIIQFIHQTTRDFFLDTGLTALAQQLSQTAITNVQVKAEAHYRLLSVCMRYMKMEETAQVLSDEINLTKNRNPLLHPSGLKRRLPFLAYAVAHWHSHAEQGDTIRNGRLLLDCFDGKFLPLYVKLENIWNNRHVESRRGGNFLHVSCRYGLMGPLQELLLRQQSHTWAVFTQDSKGQTPLSYAAKQGHMTVVRCLLELDDSWSGSSWRPPRAQSSIADRQGYTPLTWATTSRHRYIVRLLLEKGVQVDPITEDGQTPLSLAASEGSTGIARLLLDRGAQVAYLDKQDRSPLWWATARGHVDIARLLLERGAQVNAVNKNGDGPLSWAASRGRLDMVHLFLESGA